jgi:hypothetical protein
MNNVKSSGSSCERIKKRQRPTAHRKATAGLSIDFRRMLMVTWIGSQAKQGHALR